MHETGQTIPRHLVPAPAPLCGIFFFWNELANLDRHGPGPASHPGVKQPTPESACGQTSRIGSVEMLTLVSGAGQIRGHRSLLIAWNC
jgi:hypothetical protein